MIIIFYFGLKSLLLCSYFKYRDLVLLKKWNYLINWVWVGWREVLVWVRCDYIFELIVNGFFFMKDLIYSNVFIIVCVWWEVFDKMYKLLNFDLIFWKKFLCCLVL